MKFILSAIKEVLNLDPLITLNRFIFMFTMFTLQEEFISHLYDTNSFQSLLNSFSHVCIFNNCIQKYQCAKRPIVLATWNICYIHESPHVKTIQPAFLENECVSSSSISTAAPEFLSRNCEQYSYSYIVSLEDLSLRCNFVINVLLLLKFYVHLEWPGWNLM